MGRRVPPPPPGLLREPITFERRYKPITPGARKERDWVDIGAVAFFVLYMAALAGVALWSAGVF